jgi:hypothetical protein
MKLNHLIILTIAGTCLLIPLTGKALAQDSDPIRHYEVEIILYKNTKVPKSKEYTLPISSPAKDTDILDFSLPSSIEAAKKKQYEIVPDIEFRLTDIVKKIIKSSRYDILKHFAWRQPGLEKSLAMPIWIKAGRRYGNEFISIDDKIELMKVNQAVDDEANLNLVDVQNDLGEPDIAQEAAPLPKAGSTGLYEVEGKITVSLSRYLHVYTNLVLRKPRRSPDSIVETAGSDPLLYENLADARILDNHRLKDHRRMRSKTLHYLDSPEFSMLILITPYEIPLVSQSALSQAQGLATEVTVNE